MIKWRVRFILLYKAEEIGSKSEKTEAKIENLMNHKDP